MGIQGWRYYLDNKAQSCCIESRGLEVVLPGGRTFGPMFGEYCDSSGDSQLRRLQSVDGSLGQLATTPGEQDWLGRDFQKLQE